MKTFYLFFWLFLTVSVLSLNCGCGSLPDVSDMIDKIPATPQPAKITTNNELLPPEKSKAVMERLENPTAKTNILQRHNTLMESASRSPLTTGNKVTLLIDGKATYDAMFKAMEKAKVNINLETFSIEDDEAGRKFVTLLLQKQAEGVQVNLLYDSFGSSNTTEAFFKRLRDGGIQVVEFNQQNPFRTHGKWSVFNRDHRKILIVDGKIAVTGGINISQVYSFSQSGKKTDTNAPIAWRDTDIQIEGPAAAEFQTLFVGSWMKQQGPKLAPEKYFPVLKEEGNVLVRVVGSTPGMTNRVTFIAYVSAIIFAEHSVHITNAYFIPDDQTLDALTDAARRGVDVKIIIPSISDSSLALHAMRYNYSELLSAGVKLYEYRGALLHAKTAVIDGVWSTVGSTNMDFWSFLSDDEVNALILDREFAAEMEKMFAGDLAKSEQIKWEEWQERSTMQKLKEHFAHVFSHFL